MGASVEALCLGIVKQGELRSAPRFKRLIDLFRQPGPALERPSESGSWETEPKCKPPRRIMGNYGGSNETTAADHATCDAAQRLRWAATTSITSI